MERRSLLRQLLSLGSRDLTRLASDNCLTSSDQHEVKAICHALSGLYGRKLSVANLRRGAASIASYALSPLNSEDNQLLGTSTQSKSIQQYEVAKTGRREFLVIGGVVMALAVGSALYYVSPAFRTLTETVTSTLTQTESKTVTSVLTQPESTLIRPVESSITVNTSNTYRMTVSTLSYVKPAHIVQGYEMHFRTARRGKIADVRRELESQGTAYFQKTFYRQFGRRVPKRKLRIGFEREEPATEIRNDITVRAMHIESHGGRWKSTLMASKLLSYAKKT